MTDHLLALTLNTRQRHGRTGLLLVAVLLAAWAGLCSHPVQAAAEHTSGPMRLAPAIPAAVHTNVARGIFYTRTMTVTIPPGTVSLAGAPDGQTDLCTDDQATITFVRADTQVTRWSHQFAHAAGQGITCVSPVRLDDRLAPGTYTVTVELTDLFPDTYGSHAYYLVPGHLPADEASLAEGGTAHADVRTPTARPTAAPLPTRPVAATPQWPTRPLLIPGVDSLTAERDWLLIGGGILGLLLLKLVWWQRSTTRRRPSQRTPRRGLVSLYDQTTRQAHTAVLHDAVARWAIQRQPLHLVAITTDEPEAAAGFIRATESGWLLQDGGHDQSPETVLQAGETYTVMQGTITVQYRG